MALPFLSIPPAHLQSVHCTLLFPRKDSECHEGREETGESSHPSRVLCGLPCVGFAASLSVHVRGYLLSALPSTAPWAYKMRTQSGSSTEVSVERRKTSTRAEHLLRLSHAPRRVPICAFPVPSMLLPCSGEHGGNLSNLLKKRSLCLRLALLGLRAW